MLIYPDKKRVDIMKTIKCALGILFCMLVSGGASHAQVPEKQRAALVSELVSPWILTVEGESRARTLRIKGAAAMADETGHKHRELLGRGRG